jgi:hypothetical protein
MPGKPTPAAALAARLLDALRRCQAAGGDEYPVRLRDLAARPGDPPPDEALLLKAAKDKAFTAGAVVAVPGRADSPVVLKGDEARLVESPLALEAALAAKGAKGKPSWPPKGLAGAVAKPLRGQFQQVIEGQIAAGALPPFARVEKKGKTTGLYHEDHPPPPPPLPKEAVLAGRLLELLRAERAAGRYPVPIRRLAELADTTPAAPLFKKALKHPTLETFQTPWPGADEPHIALADDLTRLAASADLLTALLVACETADADAFPAYALLDKLDGSKGKAKNLLRKTLGEALTGEAALPPGIGVVRVGGGKKQKPVRHFFRLDRLRTGPAATRPAAAPAPPPAAGRTDFAAAFAAAFDRIDRATGGNNFVSLVDLRAAMPDVPREVFDAELQALRRARRYWLKSAEGYDGLRHEERAAAIPEEGELLLHVSRVRT